MKAILSILLCSMLMLGVAQQATSQQITREGGVYVSTINKTFDVKAGGSLEMERITGGVAITSWERATVEIVESLEMDVNSEEEAERIVARTLERYRQSANTVFVRGRQNERYVTRHFTIRVPRRFDLYVATAGGAISVKAITGEVDVSTAGGALVLEEIEGDVDASTAGGSIYIGSIKGDVEAATAGGPIVLERVSGLAYLSTAGGSIIVREAAQDVQASTAGGGIEVEDVGGFLDVSTAGGSIRVRDARGEADLSTAGGEIEMRNMGGRVQARTTGGDIFGRGFTGALDLETGAGDIELRDVQGPVEANANVGRIEIDVTLTEGRKPHEMRLRTSNGDIRLTLPADLPATVRAEVSLRGGRFDNKDIFSDFPLTRESSGRSDRSVRSSGDLNGGGDVLDLRTSGGSIYIRKGSQ